MKFLLIGKNGYVGKKFSLHLKTKNNLISVGRDAFNYYNRKLLAEFITQNQIAFVINCAGFTSKPNVDACEIAMHECLQGNAVLPSIIRKICEDLKISIGAFLKRLYLFRQKVKWRRFERGS